MSNCCTNYYVMYAYNEAYIMLGEGNPCGGQPPTPFDGWGAWWGAFWSS